MSMTKSELMRRCQELDAELHELDRLLGIKPWTWEPWPDRRNPYAAGTPESEAWIRVRQRGLALKAELNRVQQELDTLDQHRNAEQVA